MIDINLLRNDPDLVRENIKKKFQDKKLPLVDEILALDEKRRDLQKEGDSRRAMRNALSSKIGSLMKEKKTEEAQKVKAEVVENNARIAEIEKESEIVAVGLKEKMMAIPISLLTTCLSAATTAKTSSASVFWNPRTSPSKCRIIWIF